MHRLEGKSIQHQQTDCRERFRRHLLDAQTERSPSLEDQISGYPTYQPIAGSESNRNASKGRLFISEGDHRVDAHGAAGGDVAGQKGDCKGHYGDERKRQWVAGANAVEQAGHQTR